MRFFFTSAQVLDVPFSVFSAITPPTFETGKKRLPKSFLLTFITGHCNKAEMQHTGTNKTEAHSKVNTVQFLHSVGLFEFYVYIGFFPGSLQVFRFVVV